MDLYKSHAIVLKDLCSEMIPYLSVFGLWMRGWLHANCMAHIPSQCNVGVTYLLPSSPFMQMRHTASLLLSDATMLSASSVESDYSSQDSFMYKPFRVNSLNK